MSLRQLTGLMVCVLFLVGFASAAQQWVSLNGSSEDMPQVQLVAHDQSATSIDVILNGFWVDQVTVGNETFQRLTLGKWGSTMDIGSPMLPTLNELVGIPASSDLKVTVSDIETVTLTGYNLYPYQTPTTDDTQALPFVKDQAAYSHNALYPSEIATVSQPQIWRDVRLTELHMTPIRYNPVTGELVVVKSMRVNVEYFGSNPYHALDREATAVNPMYAKMYRGALINFDQMGINETRLDEPGTKYLFVMKAEALPFVQPLIDFRHAQGYKTEVRFIEPGFDTCDQIKAYISDLFATSHLEYVLLVGDAYYSGGPSAVDVPMYYWSGTYSDSWYVSLQGNSDYYADLAIGRIVYDTTNQLNHQVTKIMDYLQTPDTSSDWAKRSVLVAHMEQYPLKYTQCKEQIRTYSYALETPIFQPIYGGEGRTNTDVINYINNYGTGLLNYRGHGSTTAWTSWGVGQSFTATEVNQLTNYDQYFVHFDVCCDNMDFPGYNGNCLAESFMKAPAAAIAINGAIIPSYTIPNHDYDKEFYKGLYDLGIWNIGYASNFANLTVVNVHGSIGQSNYRTYLWMGDACTDLWTDIPQQLAISHASTINLATDDFTVTVTKGGQPVENALVCGQSNFAYARGFTNSSGVATLVFSEYPTTTNTVTITATAHNGLAATGSCTIVPTASPYDLYVNLTPTGSTTVSPSGGTVAYNAQVRNDETYPLETAVWTDWIYPDQTLSAPLIQRYINLTPGNLINRDLLLYVGGSEPAGTYTYRLCIGTYQGGAIYEMDTFNFTKSASGDWQGDPGPWIDHTSFTDWDGNEVVVGSVIPDNYSLSQHPNPFNPSTDISFTLPENANVNLKVYNVRGALVAELVNGYRSAGNHTVTFMADQLPSGVYISVFEANGTQLTSKLVLLK